MKFRKKPVVIDAWLWDETMVTLSEMEAAGLYFYGYAAHRDRPDECTALAIRTPEGSMRADKGDWIIKGVKGEFYPCKPDIFAATHDAEPEREEAT